MISVIIPNYNGASFLTDCLESVFKQGFSPDKIEVIVVDNGSTEDIADLMKARFPAVKLIANSTNLGFTKAINQGVEASSGDLLLLLNNDAALCDGALKTLKTELESGSATLAGVQPLMLWAGDPSIIDTTGIILSRRFHAKDRLQGQSISEAPVENVEIWGTCFGCVLMKRIVFEQCGGLDPDYFAEWDDVDFCLRARWFGWTFLLVPSAKVLHHRSPTSKRAPETRMIRIRRNQFLTYVKALPLSMAISLALYRFQRDIFMLIHYIRQHEVRARLRIWKESFMLLPRMLRTRKSLLSKARLSPNEMKRQLNYFMRQGTAHKDWM
jgi:GT2 family glycosyltransferase